VTPDFSVGALADASTAAGTSVNVTVPVTLTCFNAAIDLTLKSPPAGITATKVTIPAGGTSASFKIDVAGSVSSGVVNLTVNATGGSASHDAALKLTVTGVPGTLDSTFTNYATGAGSIRALAVQSDGQIIVGLNPGASDTGWAVKRLKANGGVDTTFNPTMPSSGTLYDVAVGSSGQISLAGDVSGGSGVAVVAIKSDGSPNILFGVNGIYNLPSPNFASTIHAKAVAVQSDDKIVVAGNLQNTDGIAARVDPNANATPQPPGKVDVQSSFSSAPMTAVGLQSTRYVVGGVKSQHVFLSAGLFAGGGLDASFGTSSGNTAYSIAGFENVNDGVVTSNGIYLCGAIQGGADVYPAIFRFDTNGKSPSYKSVNPSQAYNYRFYGCAAQPDGKIVAVGNGGTAASGYRSVVARFNADGSLDATFSPSGSPAGTYQFQVGGNTFMRAIAVQPDGRIVVGGTTPSGPTVVRIWG